MGLLLVIASSALVGLALANRPPSTYAYLLHHGVPDTVTVVSVWETETSSDEPIFHVEVRLDSGALKELQPWTPKVFPLAGRRLTVLEDPRNGKLWERTAVQHAAQRSAWVPSALGGLALATGLLGWLAVWPVRLHRRYTRSSRLAAVRGEVIRASRWHGGFPGWWVVHVHDPAGGYWEALLSRNAGAAMNADLEALTGRVVTLVMARSWFRIGASALLVSDSLLPSGRTARWCLTRPRPITALEAAPEDPAIRRMLWPT